MFCATSFQVRSQVDVTYFPKAGFPILRTSLALMFVADVERGIPCPVQNTTYVMPLK
jgi:hypothetical protein